MLEMAGGVGQRVRGTRHRGRLARLILREQRVSALLELLTRGDERPRLRRGIGRDEVRIRR